MNEEKPKVEPVRCRDGCGAECVNPVGSGWYMGQVVSGWRCPKCQQELEEVNKPKG